MNRTLKQATAKRHHCNTHAFLMAYNSAKWLKALRDLTPYKNICKVWPKPLKRFRQSPPHHTQGLTT